MPQWLVTSLLDDVILIVVILVGFEGDNCEKESCSKDRCLNGGICENSQNGLLIKY